MRRAAGWFGLSLLALGVVVTLAVVLLLQAAPGQRFLLRQAVSVVEGRIQGTLQVSGIRSAGLLRGFTLDNVVLAGSDGRSFLEADSIRVGYAVRGFLARDATLEPLELFRPRVTLETPPGDSVSNVVRIFATGDPDPEVEGGPEVEGESEGTGFRLVVRRGRIHDGTFVLRGAEGESRFENIDARLSRAVVLDPEGGERFEVEELSLVAHLDGIGEGPLRIDELESTWVRRGTSLSGTLTSLVLGETRASGQLEMDWADGVTLGLELEADPFHGADLAWLDARIPEVTGRFRVEGEGPLATGTWRFDEVALVLEEGRHRLDGRVGIELGETLRLVDTDVSGEFWLSLADPWLEAPLPVQGRIRADARLSGPLAALQVNGTVALDDPEEGVPESRAQLQGRVNLGAGTVAGMRLRVDPLRLETLRTAGLDYVGTGTLDLEATGGLERGIELDATLVHATAALDVSRISARGRIEAEGETFRLALDTEVDPLSMVGVERALGVEVPLSGELRGAMRLEGALTDLTLSGEVATAGGPVSLVARLDATDPGRAYRVEGTTDALDLGALLEAAPEGSTLAGRFDVEGAGLDPATLDARVDVELHSGRWGRFDLEEGRGFARALDGRLYLDTLRVRSVLGTLDGSGELGLAEGAPAGEVTVDWRLEDLGALRPILLGDAGMDTDTLSALERDLLLFEGVDVAPEATIPLGGSASGTLRLTGGLADLEARLQATGEELAWREMAATGVALTARAHLEAADSGHVVRALEGTLELDAPSWGDWAFEAVRLDAEGDAQAAELRLELDREEGERYQTAGRLSRLGDGVVYEVSELAFLLDPVAWALVRPSRVAWADGRLEIDDLEVARPGNGEAVRMFLDGSFETEGPLDLRVEASGVDLARLAGILQLDPVPEGILDLDLDVAGTAPAPLIDGSLLLRDLVVGDTRLDRVAGTLGYAAQLAEIQLDVDRQGSRLTTVRGTWPVDLAFAQVETRIPEGPVDLVIEVNDLPAATALAPLEALEEVGGTFDGRVVLRGTPTDLEPSGELRLTEGRFALLEIGIAPGLIEATFTLNPDGRVEVEARGQSVGPVEVSGTVDLANLLDPGFDLEVQAQGFQAVNRRDLEGRLSGTMFLRGRYREPRVTGSIRVDQANLFLEEFARTAEVVDLSDPAFLAAVDTTLAAAREVAEAAQNPFLENLRVDADLALPRDVWLRSREMNVEIGGDLIVTFDRANREILLVGGVQAVRGNYNAFGRQFQVRGGTVDFVGTPGINPALSIEAVHRLRQQGGEPLEIVASLQGTLLQPRITLSAEGAGVISESDLISYLIFGRPSYALAAAESRMLGDAAISAGLGAAAGQLSTLLGQQIGLDFFSITQAQDVDGVGALSGEGLADTQVELGQYLTDNVFLGLVLRPLRGIGGSQAQIPGARVEWRFTDLWTLNAYVEDRFGREGVFTFGELGLQVNRIYGLEIYREWGY